MLLSFLMALRKQWSARKRLECRSFGWVPTRLFGRANWAKGEEDEEADATNSQSGELQFQLAN